MAHTVQLRSHLDAVRSEPSVQGGSNVAGFFLAIIGMLLFLRPHPNFLPPVVATYGADLIILAVILFSLPAVRWRFPAIAVKWTSSLYVIGCVFAVLLLNAVRLDAVDPLIATANLLRFVYYGIVLIAVASLARTANLHWSHLNRAIAISLWFNVAIATLQLLEPPGMGALVHAVYGDEKLRSIWTGFPRVYGTFANANWFGVFVLFTFTFFFCGFLLKVLPARSFMVNGLLSVYLLMISGSRTGLIGLAISCAVILILQRRLVMGALVTILAIQFPSIVNLLQDELPQMAKSLERFTEFTSGIGSGDLSNVDSLSGRQQSWVTAWEYVLQRPFVGHGDSAVGGDLIPHNGYLTILLTVGLLGAVPLLCWLCALVIRVALYPFRSRSSRLTGTWFLVFSPGFAAMTFAADFVYTSQVMLLWLGIIAVFWAIADQDEVHHNSGMIP